MGDFRSVREAHITHLEIACFEYDVDPQFLDALIHIESSWNPWAIRYEKNWKYFQKPEENARFLRITVETELVSQRTSWGLCQIMGGTARSNGYLGHITQLLDPDINMRLACKIIRFNEKRYPDNLEARIAAYNAGSAMLQKNGRFTNQEYVDKFMKKYHELKAFWQHT